MLTPKQFDLARYIETYIRKKGRAPTYKEMCEATNANMSLVYTRLLVLETRGIIARGEKGKHRSITMLKSAVLFAPYHDA